MRLEEVGNGRVYTHLYERLKTIEAASFGSRGQVEAAFDDLNRDPVYQDIAAGRFHSPVRACPAADRLRDGLEWLDSYAGSRPDLRLGVFPENIRKVFECQPTWDEYSCFTVPVMAGEKEKSPALVYLAVRPRPSYTRTVQGHLPIRQLTQDPGLIESTVDYFGMIAAVLVKTIYFLQVPLNDPLPDLCAHSYELLFNCQITEGKSIGAATLAAFGIAYIHRVCGAGSLSGIIAPEPGTLITGEIDRDGRVLPVDHLDEKVGCAIEEYGSSLKVIVPGGAHLSPGIESRIDSDRLYYVDTAEELLDVALSSPDRPDGLLSARKTLFSLLEPPDIERFTRHVVSDVTPEVYDQIRSGRVDWRTPDRHPPGIYALGRTARDTLEVRIGLEPSALQKTEATDQKELIEVVVDGSYEMSDHWIPGRGGICSVTGAVFEIASRIDPDRQELVYGFLSHDRFYNLRGAPPATQIEADLQKVRDDEGLEYKGPFFMPIYEASAEQYSKRLKRLFIISDSMIPDLDDIAYPNLSSLHVVTLNAAGDDVPASNGRVCLTGKDGRVDEAVVDGFFHRQQGELRTIKLDLGESLPICWRPSSGELSKVKDRFVLDWSNIADLSPSLHVQVNGQPPRSVGVSGEISRNGGLHPFEFTQYLKPDQVDPIHTVSGTLDEKDFREWERVSSSEPVELLSYPHDTSIYRSLAIPGLRHLNGGYVALRAGSPDWCFFDTGCRFGGIVVVRLGGRLHYSEARGRVKEINMDGELYRLRIDDKTYFFCGVQHHD